MVTITIQSLTKRFGGTAVLRGIDLQIQAGELFFWGRVAVARPPCYATSQASMSRMLGAFTSMIRRSRACRRIAATRA